MKRIEKCFWENKGSIIYNRAFYSCEDLRKRIDKVGTYLSYHHYSKKVIVAIAMERGVWPLAIMLALLAKGIPFLSVDMSYPEKRRRYMMEQLDVDVVITEDKFQNCFAEETVVTLSEMKRESQNIHNIERMGEQASDEDIAYYIYTSGSTGAPKAVEITQKAFRNFIQEFPKKVLMESGKRITSFASMTFDIFFLETITALIKGMCVVLASEEERINPGSMAKLICDNRADFVQLTPSHLQMLHYYDEDFSCLKQVKNIMVGGEIFPFNLLKDLQEQTHARIFNLYGPTETTVWASVADLTNEKEIHVGTPIGNVKFCILDKNGEEVPEGTEGEICISGLGVANGYKNDKELSAKQFFVPDFDLTARYYHTGDKGRMERGKFYCMGREDNQIKYRGHRIELEEIDSSLNRIPGIVRAVTFFVKTGEREALISLYESRQEIEIGTIREILMEELADYMIPKDFRKVDRLYLSVNGKVDRERNFENYIKENTQPVRTNTKRKRIREINELVLCIVKEHLQNKELELSENSSLEDLALDSLDYVYMVVGFEEAFGVEFEEEMLSFHKFELIRDIVEYIKYLTNEKRGVVV